MEIATNREEQGGVKQRVGNVSAAADAEFMRLLEKEDPRRYERLIRNVRQQNPVIRMSEDQAAANFILGLPTGQHRFVIVAGKNQPISEERSQVDYLPHNGTAEEWAKAIVALAHSDSPAPTTVDKQSEPTPTGINRRRAGRPKVYRSSGERQQAYRRRMQVETVTK
jgi:hypothetical protein